jgi:hypothetical protein
MICSAPSKSDGKTNAVMLFGDHAWRPKRALYSMHGQRNFRRVYRVFGVSYKRPLQTWPDFSQMRVPSTAKVVPNLMVKLQNLYEAGDTIALNVTLEDRPRVNGSRWPGRSLIEDDCRRPTALSIDPCYWKEKTD